MAVQVWGTDAATSWPKAHRFWYVKVRQADTGAEIQRLFSSGATSEAEAVADMWRYLETAGRARVDAKGWQVVTVARWS